MLALSWALLLDWKLALPLAFFCGLALDFLGAFPYPLGFQAMLFCIIAFPLTFLKKENFRALGAGLVTIGSCFSYRVLLLIASGWVGYNSLLMENFSRVVIPLVVIDAVLMLIVFILARRLSNIRVSRE